MKLAEFERQIADVATDSAICGIPVIRRLTSTAINIRLSVSTGGFIDAFHNEHTGTTAFTLIFPIPKVMSFAEFVADRLSDENRNNNATCKMIAACLSCCILHFALLKKKPFSLEIRKQIAEIIRKRNQSIDRIFRKCYSDFGIKDQIRSKA